jgi:hypothetical protein
MNVPQGYKEVSIGGGVGAEVGGIVGAIVGAELEKNKYENLLKKQYESNKLYSYKNYLELTQQLVLELKLG